MAEQNRVRRRLPSDAEFLLDYMEGLPSDDSDSDFDSYDGLISDDDYLPVLPLQQNFENSSSQNYFSTSNTLIPTMHFPDTIVSGLASCSSCILTTTTTTYPVPLTPTTSYTYPSLQLLILLPILFFHPLLQVTTLLLQQTSFTLFLLIILPLSLLVKVLLVTLTLHLQVSLL